MAADIYAVLNLLQGRVTITSKDYKEILRLAGKRDLVYMDPPYQGISENSDPRYYGGIYFEELMQSLAELTSGGISFILSYDGRTGNKTYGSELPAKLEMRHIEINAGRSTQATLLGREAITYESLYLSKALVARLGLSRHERAGDLSKHPLQQLKLFSA